MNKTHILPEESVFSDNDGNYDEDSQPIITYLKNKYYAVALLNRAGKVIKVTDGKILIKKLIIFVTNINTKVR